MSFIQMIIDIIHACIPVDYATLAAIILIIGICVAITTILIIKKTDNNAKELNNHKT